MTDSLPALALGVDPADEGIMDQKPDLSSSLLSPSAFYRIAYQGIMIGTLTLVAFLYGSGRFLNPNGSLELGQTMAFTVLALSQLTHAYNIHSPHSSVFKTFFKNKWLVLGTLVNAVMMFAVLLIPSLREIFNLVALSAQNWEMVALLVIIPLPFVELMKLLKLNGKD